MRRVVVTGLGMVTPLANGVEPTWSKLLAGQSGIRTIEAFDVSDLPAKVGGMVPRGEGEGLFQPTDYVEAKELRRNDDFIVYGIAAAVQAVEDSGWKPTDEEQRCRTGVLLGSGIGGLNTIADTTLILEKGGPRRVSPFFIPAALINLASGQVSIKYGFKGPNHAVVTACSTGAHAIGDAARLIALDDADVMVAGGCEAALGRIGMAGFCAARALSTGFNDDAGEGLAPLGQGPRRLRHGRGCGHRGARGIRARQARAARRSTPRSRATACPATPITSPPPARAATAASARCRRRSSGPA